MRRGLTAFVACALACSVAAHDEPAPSVARPPPAPCCLLAAGTPVEIELTQLVTSRTAKPDQWFDISLAGDISQDGVVVATAGAKGSGQVVDSAPGGLAGRPGKLILAARFVTSGSIRLPLRSFKLSGTGRDTSKTVMALSNTPYVGILALGVHGGNIDYPAGTRAIAKIAADTFIATTSAIPAVPPAPNDGAAAPLAKDKTS